MSDNAIILIVIVLITAAGVYGFATFKPSIQVDTTKTENRDGILPTIAGIISIF